MTDHPAFTALIGWPILSGLLTWLFKPRTPAEYAALPPWVADALILVAKAGVDVPGIRIYLRRLLKLPPELPDAGSDKNRTP